MVPHHPRAWQQYCCSNDSNSRPVRARDSWISAANLDKCHLVVRWRRSDLSPIDSPPDLAACLQNTSGVLSSLPTNAPGCRKRSHRGLLPEIQKTKFQRGRPFFFRPNSARRFVHSISASRWACSGSVWVERFKSRIFTRLLRKISRFRKGNLENRPKSEGTVIARALSVHPH